jgi:exosortase A-associated hydrolase 1
MEETAAFRISGQTLYGILHLPSGGAPVAHCLVMVVGGPQDRSGSHRSYTYLARALAQAGVPVFRFDYLGIGDSHGDWKGFGEAGPAVQGAIDFLTARFPSLKKAILWSLCDGAAACALYARRQDPRVGGMILCNPYVHSAQGQAAAFLKHYYLRRLCDPSFWRKVFAFRFNPIESAGSMRAVAQSASGKATGPIAGVQVGPGEDPPQLPDKVMEGLSRFSGPVYLLLSTADMTALEFLDLYNRRGGAKSGVVWKVEGADHTFTAAAWKREVAEKSLAAWNAITAAA